MRRIGRVVECPSPRASIRSIVNIYDRLLGAFGPQRWWPAKTAFEVIVGAILTQATNWSNVEQAIAGLRKTNALSPRKILSIRTSRLERLIRSSGYFRQKARRLKDFSSWYLKRYGGKSSRMFRTPWPDLRRELLDLKGIGPETADSILLYAGGQPIFVVDTYTKRVLGRHRMVAPRMTYPEIQRLVMEERLPEPAKFYNEFHALIVAVGKKFCHRYNPTCAFCPLGDLPKTSEVRINGCR